VPHPPTRLLRLLFPEVLPKAKTRAAGAALAAPGEELPLEYPAERAIVSLPGDYQPAIVVQSES